MNFTLIEIRVTNLLKQIQEASEAYQVLSDSQKKSNYDQFGHAAFENSGGVEWLWWL